MRTRMVKYELLEAVFSWNDTIVKIGIIIYFCKNGTDEKVLVGNWQEINRL